MWGQTSATWSIIPGAPTSTIVNAPMIVTIPGEVVVSASIHTIFGVACTASGNAYMWGLSVSGYAQFSLPANDGCVKVVADAGNTYVLTYSGVLIARNSAGTQITYTPLNGERGINFAVVYGGGMIITSPSSAGSKFYSFGFNTQGNLMMDTSTNVPAGVVRPASLLVEWAAALTSPVVDFHNFNGVFYVRLGPLP